MTAEAISGPAVGSSYPGDGSLYDDLALVEDLHFWFRARNTIVAAAMDRVIPSLPKNYRVLEIGCGTGNVLSVLEKKARHGQVIGMDLFARGFKYARQRTACGLVQADLYSPPFNIEFDLIGMFDVIEHLALDQSALRQVNNLLRKHGKLLITVPAHKYLWSYADQFAGHYRRYEATQLRQLLDNTGFSIDYETEFMRAATPLIWLNRRLLPNFSKGRKQSEPKERFLAELRLVPILNGLLRWLIEREADSVRDGIQMKFGTSLLAIASKR